MIGYLEGKLLSIENEILLLDVQGVGYELTCSVSTLAELQAEPGKICKVFVYTQLREDLLQLFGFSTKEEKTLFLTLLKVNGIGPKMAINIISGANIKQIHHMIEEGDVKALTALPKVGKKIAEQMILTLKGKLVVANSGSNFKSTNRVHSEIASALVNLGFKQSEVDKVVQTFDKNMDLQEGIRQGLQRLSHA